MKARPEYRDRDRTEVAILDALVDRREEGLTVFELRSKVDASIDEIEDALAALKADHLIHVENERGSRTLIKPDDRVVPDPDTGDDEPSLLDQVLGRLRP